VQVKQRKRAKRGSARETHEEHLRGGRESERERESELRARTCSVYRQTDTCVKGEGERERGSVMYVRMCKGKRVRAPAGGLRARACRVYRHRHAC
jgi:hypothetical protein